MVKLRYGYIILVALIPLAALYAVVVARPDGALEIMAGTLFICALAIGFGLRLAGPVLVMEDSVRVRTPFADYRFRWELVIGVSVQGPKSFLHVRGVWPAFAITRKDYDTLSRRLAGTGLLH